MSGGSNLSGIEPVGRWDTCGQLAKRVPTLPWASSGSKKSRYTLVAVATPLRHANLSILEHILKPARIMLPGKLAGASGRLPLALVGAGCLVPRDTLSVAIFISAGAVARRLGFAVLAYQGGPRAFAFGKVVLISP
jgi:hypothetical protein